MRLAVRFTSVCWFLAGMVLADPLMSLIDTACVGHVSALQLAALGPNTAIFNFVFQASCVALFTFSLSSLSDDMLLSAASCESAFRASAS